MTASNPFRTRLTAALAIAGLAAGCASQKPLPEDRYYRLPEAEVAQSLQRPVLAGTLAVRSYDTAAVFRERALTYAEADSPDELRHFHFHHWADDPPTLLQQHLVQFLRTKNVASQVVPDEATFSWDYLLKGRLTHFERREGGGQADAVVEMEFVLERFGDPRLRLVKTYRQTRPIDGTEVYPTVEAFAKALTAVYEQLSADIAAGGR